MWTAEWECFILQKKRVLIGFLLCSVYQFVHLLTILFSVLNYNAWYSFKTLKVWSKPFPCLALTDISRNYLLKSHWWCTPCKNPRSHLEAERGATALCGSSLMWKSCAASCMYVAAQVKVVNTDDLAVGLILNQSIGYLLFQEPFLSSKQMAPRWLSLPGLSFTSKSVLSSCQRTHLPRAAVLASAGLHAGNLPAPQISGI